MHGFINMAFLLYKFGFLFLKFISIYIAIDVIIIDINSY